MTMGLLYRKGMMMNSKLEHMLENKWMRGALPAILLHVCIGTVYCWSLLKGEIAAAIGCQTSQIEMAFSLAIFFLGMSAAFGGQYVEHNVKRSSCISMVAFVCGLLGSILAIRLQSVPLLFLFYGCVMGIGLGIGYLSPVKTLMLWFTKHKGLATGIAISGFGLAKVLFSPFITWCNAAHGVTTTLLLMACISIVLMGIAVLLIRKPADWVEPMSSLSFKELWSIIGRPDYMKIWFIFYLNITCGLAIIAFEKDLALASCIVAVGMLSSLTALFNTLGRFGYSTVSDVMTRKAWIYVIIFASSFAVSVANGLTSVFLPLLVIIGMCIINAGYGGGFSTLPTLLQSRFGMGKISTIHGMTLSAWAMAGLSGNQLSNLILNHWGGTFNDLFFVIAALYGLSCVLSVSLLNMKKNETNETIIYKMKS